MFSIKTILAPFDFSPRCRAGARHAIALAERFGAQLEFVHVTPDAASYAAFEGGAYVGLAWPKPEEVRDKLDEELGKIEVPDDVRASWKRTVVAGDPAGTIREIAEAADDPLVVVPTHGFGTFRRFVFGSVTNKLLHDLNRPILTGAHLEDEPPFVDLPYKRILCALDLREPSHDILPWAQGFAQAFDAAVDVVHAVDLYQHNPILGGDFSPNLRSRLIETARQELEPLLAKHGITGHIHIDIEAAEDYIPRVQKQTGADLLVIGRSTERGITDRLWGRAYELIRSSATPVVSV